MTRARYLGHIAVHQDKYGNITIDLVKGVDYVVVKDKKVKKEVSK